ncbi:PrpF domain-containing protein [Chromobacterium sp. IIBBL 290-4]|uniref:PrpF domain-containing protein n=1 Tax=Chromobacterium sp. IIBBL 290-4 TaxID=2953890 RepID=UPI0020B71E04|nr:PrpF domain-containing protein [Chromobacterium sp. IIBBL 290-4]UTH73865.1 hypothetical protein NKT35_20330 [Chromobacterium sp. IIBBL 290-4]
MNSCYRLPATLMRGGTSKGLFVRADALPEDTERWEAMLLRAIGSPDPNRLLLDGLGHGRPGSSKVVILSPSRREDCDVDCLFAHVAPDVPRIDWSGHCGNLSAAIPLFAAMENMIQPQDGVATVSIWQANVGKRILAELEIFNGEPVWQGDFLIDGITFPGAPIRLRFLDPAGSRCGELYPSGRLIEELMLPDGSRVEATLIDAGNPTAFVQAKDFGLSGHETQLDIPRQSLQRLALARASAAVAMGLAKDIFEADRESPASPRISILAPGIEGETHLHARILSGHRLHDAFSGTGAIALACACATEGTLPARLAGGAVRGQALTFSHGKGLQTLEAVLGLDTMGWKIDEVVMTRTARPLMRGEVYIPMEPL